MYQLIINIIRSRIFLAITIYKYTQVCLHQTVQIKHTSHSTFQIQYRNHTVQSVSKLHLAQMVEHMHRPLPALHCNLHNFRWSRILLHIANVISLWPSDAIWPQGSRSTLVQVMACCLTATSHYLNQCWLVITKVHWCSSEGNFTFKRHHSHQSLKLAWCV